MYLIYSIILILFGIYLLVEAYIKKDSYAQYVYGSILILFGIGFLISRGHVKMMKVYFEFQNLLAKSVSGWRKTPF